MVERRRAAMLQCREPFDDGRRIRMLLSGRSVILVVVDNARLRRACEGALVDAGYLVRHARDADGALRIAEDGSQRVDLMIVDLSVAAASDGVVRQSSRPLPVLYLSRDAHDLANTAPRARIGAILTMPFDTPELLHCVARLLGRGPATPLRAPGPVA